MSRVSSKSGLTPSATRGSSAIDLGKDSGVDMGRKTQPSATSGGIGVTQEVGSIGGMTVTGGVSVEVSPLSVGISADPSNNSISISGSAELPGGFLGIGGGATIDTGTGEIIGGSVGGEVLGLGINISASNEGDVGVEFTLQIPFTPVEISLGFEFPKKKNEPSTPTLDPTPSSPNVGFPVDEILPLLNDNDCYHAIGLIHGTIQFEVVWPPNIISNVFVRDSLPEEQHGGGVWINNANPFQGTRTNLPYERTPSYISRHIPPDIPASAYWSAPEQFANYGTNHKAYSIINGSYQLRVPNGYRYIESVLSAFWIPEFNGARIKRYIANNRYSNIWDISVYKIPCEKGTGESPQRVTPNSPSLPNFVFPPFPNPPPRRQNVDECCRDSIKMLRRLSTVMQVDNVLKGKVQIPGELIAIPEKDEALPPEILQTYPQMVNAILLAINRHGMDAPIIVEIEDTDKTTAGDQEAVYTYNSPAVAMQAALEMLHELKAAGNARLSIQIGIAFAVTRILKTVAGIGESIREIIKMLGMPFRYKPKKMLLEFNLSGIKKGYGKDSKPKEFAEMSKEELENIIPTLLEGSECDVPVPTFTASEADDIRQMLCKLTIRKEK